MHPFMEIGGGGGLTDNGHRSKTTASGIIPTIMANDPSNHPVMAVLDTAIHA
jgi:hypothetical protein